ncbi:hypothetical protein AYJ54_17900 [Bradyrhizobium centrolobii]|uniref:Uncharacterized protein n=1 Tax=Bradyrhizobium centrolobii TaxID=1505087 RepID=A0A176YKQ1_9BRAD|nr:hypothetical protein [Bradyrhizobium centrolobii]OAF07201.1 hypothetical protein AYJ54_17900 [Bradyrhizobium centrolobii]
MGSIDGPFPRHQIDTGSALRVATRFKLVVDIVDRERPTIRQFVQRLAGARGSGKAEATDRFSQGATASLLRWY